jgi:hypothetical protein
VEDTVLQYYTLQQETVHGEAAMLAGVQVSSFSFNHLMVGGITTAGD